MLVPLISLMNLVRSTKLEKKQRMLLNNSVIKSSNVQSIEKVSDIVREVTKFFNIMQLKCTTAINENSQTHLLITHI